MFAALKPETDVLLLHRIIVKNISLLVVNKWILHSFCLLPEHTLPVLFTVNPSGLLFTEVYYNCILYTYMPLKIDFKLQNFTKIVT